MKLQIVLPLIVITLLIAVPQSHGKTAKKASNTLSPGTKDIASELKVTGQTRTLNMMLVLKNKKDRIEFINVRKNFRKEILATEF